MDWSSPNRPQAALGLGLVLAALNGNPPVYIGFIYLLRGVTFVVWRGGCGGLSLAKLLEFRGKLKEASNLLKDAETLIAAMLIIDEYKGLGEVESIVERALERIREARRIGRELVEEVERALPPEPLEEEP
jgi:hypothetical protein